MSVYVLGGAAGMVSRITGSVGKGLAAITMDKEYQQKRREERNRPPKDFGESLAKGGKGFLKVHKIYCVTEGTTYTLFKITWIFMKYIFSSPC